jgi:hypothetical protein
VAIPRWYVISVMEATVPEQNAEGNAWDSVGLFGAPEEAFADARITVVVDDEQTFQSDTVTDANGEIELDLSGDVSLIGGSKIEIRMEDVDSGGLGGSSTEQIVLCELIVSEDLLRSRQLPCTGDGATVVASVVPRQ